MFVGRLQARQDKTETWVVAMVEKRLRTNINFGQRCQVLCVDDNALTMHLLSLILQQQGYDVLTSPDPTMAIKALKQGAVDWALLDYEMPQMNGGELAALVEAAKQKATSLFSSSAIKEDLKTTGFLTLEEIKRRAIIATVNLANGDKMRAAKMLGVGKNTVCRALEGGTRKRAKIVIPREEFDCVIAEAAD